MDFNVHFPNLDEIKTHVKEHKMAYAIGATAVVASGVTFLVTRRTITIAPVFNNTVAPVINNVINNGGHMRKIVRCLETNELWLSVTDAALAQGKNVSLMSQHLNHPEIVPHINELHFVIEALATN